LCRCDDVDVPSERMVIAAIKAANHLSEHGLPPIFDPATTAAMYELAGDA
jgi:hypothetical protein